MRAEQLVALFEFGGTSLLSMLASEEPRITREQEILADIVHALIYPLGLKSELVLFLLNNGRLPHLGDEKPPWKYRGWLLPAVQQCDSRTIGRWATYLRIMETCQLPAELPSLDFASGEGTIRYHDPRVQLDEDPPLENSKRRRGRRKPERPILSNGESGKAAAIKQLERACEHIGSHVGYGFAVGNLIEWLAFGLGVHAEECEAEVRMSDEVCEHLYRTLDLWPLMVAPYDYLGYIKSLYKGRGYDPAGFFPTPPSVATAGAQMLFTGLDPREAMLKSVHDCCVGTGVLLLAASNHSLILSGQDIQRECVLGTLIQGALYAPWLSFPFPKPLIEALRESAGPAGTDVPAQEYPAGVQLNLFPNDKPPVAAGGEQTIGKLKGV